MSMGFRIGGSYISPKKPPKWALELFALFFFAPIALVFAAGGWCVIFARRLFK